MSTLDQTRTRATPGTLVQREFVTKSAFTLDAKERTIDVICSTDALDSYGESVEQSWNLDRYNANPVVLYAHNARELPIGRGRNMRVTRSKSGRAQLECTIKFASAAANPLAEQVMQCFAEGVLGAVSVGFIPGSVRTEKRDGRDVTILADNTLHELSVTPVPANPEALAKGAPAARQRSAPNLDASPGSIAAIALARAAAEEPTLADDIERVCMTDAERDAYDRVSACFDEAATPSAPPSRMKASPTASEDFLEAIEARLSAADVDEGEAA